MDSFERRLRSLPPVKPSDSLRDRIFEGSAGHKSTAKRVGPWRPVSRIVFSRRIALGWAAAVALTTGLAGFVLGDLSGGASPQDLATQSNIEVRIVEAASDRHNFDLTTTPADFLTGDVRVEVETQQEI